MKAILIAVCALVLAGCEKVQGPQPDQCMRAELFAKCLSLLPAGPSSTQYNDWSEVVDSCQNAAYYQSLRGQAQIKPECRP